MVNVFKALKKKLQCTQCNVICSITDCTEIVAQRETIYENCSEKLFPHIPSYCTFASLYQYTYSLDNNTRQYHRSHRLTYTTRPIIATCSKITAPRKASSKTHGTFIRRPERERETHFREENVARSGSRPSEKSR